MNQPFGKMQLDFYDTTVKKSDKIDVPTADAAVNDEVPIGSKHGSMPAPTGLARQPASDGVTCCAMRRSKVQKNEATALIFTGSLFFNW